MKVLINVPDLKKKGGVGIFYVDLKDYWQSTVKYNIIGRRNNISGIFWLPWDSVKFIFYIIFFKPDIILLNPSLGEKALPRDFYFIRLATLFHKKTSIFIHGWDREYAERLKKEWAVYFFNKASCLLVLASAFKRSLEEWGVRIPIYLTGAKVGEGLVKDFNIACRDGKINTLLFLGRIVKEKGVLIAVTAYKILKEKYHFLKMFVIGNGGYLPYVIEYINKNDITDITITGSVTESELSSFFKEADLYIFPTYFGEGMPSTVSEAMAFGLPVITRPVGGLADFFENGKMGEIMDSMDPEDFACAIERYICDPKLTMRVSRYNYEYARNHFLAHIVAANFEKIFERIHQEL